MILIVISSPPFSPKTCQALDFIEQKLHDNQAVTLFLYGDGAYLANRLVWLASDMPNPAQKLQQLAKHTSLSVQACVSTALARGITDTDNAKRHHLTASNLMDNCQLTGLGELAMHLHNADSVYQF